nr:hypothetical protein [Janibacter melonis]
MSVRFTKGHGTENDFVLLADLDGRLDLSAAQVARLSDRHAGIGGDGVIRVVRTVHAEEPEVRAQADEAEFFMDYRNADGSKAQMCGNGTRVFATWLRREGLIGDGESVVATRAGTRRVRFEGDEVVTHMGTWSLVHPSEAAERGVDSFVHVDEAEDVDDPYSALSSTSATPHRRRPPARGEPRRARPHPRARRAPGAAGGQQRRVRPSPRPWPPRDARPRARCR